MPRKGSGRKSGWPRALGLMFATLVFAPAVNPGVLVAVPLALMALLLPPRGGLAILTAGLGAVLVFGGGPRSGLWYAERGWSLLLGGWFLALTLRWPTAGFFGRGLGAVAGTFAAISLLFWGRPGQWAVVDWAVTSRLEEGFLMVLEAVRSSFGPEVVSEDLQARVLEGVALNGFMFPALLGLASLAALGVAWWLFQRLSRNGDPGIGPLTGFRFNDQLVWILIVGFALLLGFSGFLGRAGTNTVVFMGALFALRGVAVWLFFSGGLSVSGGLLFAVALVFFAPFIAAGAFVFGLGDSWLDLRARWGGQAPGEPR